MSTLTLSKEHSLENTIRRIWAEVLKIKAQDITLTDNFFLLGGDSLVMAQIKIRLEEKTGLKFTLGNLFILSSIKKMADFCHQHLNPQSYQASAAQAGLWFIHQFYDSQRTLYNVSAKVELRGLLDLESLQHALQELVRRHSTLRSNFHFDWENNTLFVKEVEEVFFDCPIVTINEANLTKAITSFSQQEFNLENELLIRACVFQLAEEKHVLILSLHHIVTDGWSGSIFLKELSQLYMNLIHKNHNTNIPISPQYKDYCDWQNKQMKGELFTGQLAFWHKELKNLPIPLRPFRSNPEAEQISFESAIQTFELKAYAFAELKDFARAESISLFMLTLAVFKLALGLRNEVKDFAVGVPVANRKKIEWESVIGYYVNPVIIRTTIDGDNSFQDFLQQIKQTALNALQHQDIPFQTLVKKLRPSDSFSQNPFYNILFAYQNLPSEELDFDGLEATVKKIRNSLCHYDLNLEVEETEAGLCFNFEYAKELYDKTQVVEFVLLYQKILHSILQNPSIKINLI